MSRKRNRAQQGRGAYGNDMYWQTSAYNARLCMKFERQIAQLATTRFLWEGLPDTVDPWYLEQVLFTEGVATIATPKSGRGAGHLFAGKAVLNGRPNLYAKPTRWRFFGYDGRSQFECDASNAVLVYDNVNRVPILDDVNIYAMELADIMRTKQINRFHQRIPFALKAPYSRKNDMINIGKQIAGGEVVTLFYDDVDAISNATDLLTSGVQYIGEELDAAYRNLWAEVKEFLGINALPVKSERMIEDEVVSQQEPSELMALSPLMMRRAAADRLNKRFAAMLDGECRVVWRRDNQSDNWAYAHSLQAQAETEGRIDHESVSDTGLR